MTEDRIIKMGSHLCEGIHTYARRCSSYFASHRWARAALFALVIALVFFSVLLLNMLTPVDLGDDIKYRSAISSAEGKLGSMQDIWKFLQHCYYYDNPRLPFLFFSILSLMLPSIGFDILNACIYTLFVLLLYAHVVPAGKHKAVGTLILVSICAFLLVPAFGETSLWASGSSMYLWTSAWTLLFLLPYTRVLQAGTDGKKNFPLAAAMIPLGLLAGWSNFNTGGVALLFAALSILICVLRKQRLPVWTLMGAGFCLVGLLILAASPAIGATRTDISGLLPSVRYSGGNGLVQVVFSVLNKVHIQYMVLLLAAISFVLICTFRRNDGDVIVAAVYLICGLAGIVSCFLTTGIPLRALHIAATMGIVMILYPIGRLQNTGVALQRVATVVIALILPYCLLSYGRAVIDLKALSDGMNAAVTFREDGSVESVDTEIYDSLSPHTRYNMYFPGDIWE